MASSIFDILNYIVGSKPSWDELTEEEQNAVNPYMLHRFISMNKDYIDVVNMMQKYQNSSAKSVYEFYCKALPKKKTFFKYIKSSVKYDVETLKGVAEFFGCSKREAKEYLEFLSNEEIDVILNQVNGVNNKKKKK